MVETKVQQEKSEFKNIGQPLQKQAISLQKVVGFDRLFQLQQDMLNKFDQFKQCDSKNLKMKKQLMNEFIQMYCTYASIEEVIVYPLIEEIIPEGNNYAKRNYWLHMKNRINMEEIWEMESSHLQFSSKCEHLMPYIREMFNLERSTVFSKARSKFSDSQLAMFDTLLRDSLKVVPRTPRDTHKWFTGSIYNNYYSLFHSFVKGL